MLSQEIVIGNHFLFREYKAPRALYNQPGKSPALPCNVQTVFRHTQKPLQRQNVDAQTLLNHILHLLLSANADQEFFHILLPALIYRKCSVILCKLRFASRENPDKFRRIKQIYRLLPVAFSQICKMEQILHSSQRGFRHRMLHRNHERNVILSPIADNIKISLYYISFFCIFPMKTKRDFHIAALKLFRQTLHPQVRRYDCAVGKLSLRCIDVERPFVYFPLPQTNLDLGAGKIQRTFFIVEVSF